MKGEAFERRRDAERRLHNAADGFDVNGSDRELRAAAMEFAIAFLRDLKGDAARSGRFEFAAAMHEALVMLDCYHAGADPRGHSIYPDES